MKIFLTGAFGNIGRSTIEALLARGHSVRTFDLLTPANRKAAKKLAAGKNGSRIETTWGDLRRPEDLSAALGTGDIDAALHLGFVIPKLSVTGVNSEDQPDFARAVNVGGTRNLLQALRALEHKPRLVFASSFHVYGMTQHLPPPRTIDETPHPVEHYARHKVEAEALVRDSGLEWAILRLAACLPIQLILDQGMFDVPLENRIEYIHTRDAGTAFATAAEHPSIWGKILHIGGGPRCQYYYREVLAQVLEAAGIGSLPERCFTSHPFATDWVDTSESQALLQFQQRTLADYAQDLRRLLGPLRIAVLALRPFIRRWIIARSPYGKIAPTHHAGKLGQPIPVRQESREGRKKR